MEREKELIKRPNLKREKGMVVSDYRRRPQDNQKLQLSDTMLESHRRLYPEKTHIRQTQKQPES